MGKHFLRSNAFRNLLICYVLILILPMIFGFWFYNSYNNTFRIKNKEANQQALQQAANVIDERLRAAISIGDTISVSGELMKIRYFELPLNANKYFKLHKAAKSLSPFTALSESIEYFYVYCHKLDCILDSGHIYTKDNQLDSVIEKRLGMSGYGFRQLLENACTNSFVLSEDQKHILFINTMNMMEKKPNLSAILVLNTEPIQQVMSELSETCEGSAFLMFENKIAFCDDKEAAERASQTADAKNTDVMLRLQVESTCSALSFHLHIPMAVYTRETDAIWHNYLICEFVLLIVGIIIACILAARNYQPIYKLRQVAEVSNTEKDEFTVIQNKIRDVINSSQMMNKRIDELNQIASNSAFHALVSGDIAYMQEHPNAGVNISFNGNLFVACLVELDVPAGTPSMSIEQNGEELCVLMNNLLAGLCSEKCQFLVRREDDIYYVILCFDSQEKDNAEIAALDTMEMLLRLMWRSFSVAARIYVGTTVEGVNNIYLSCSNAQKARDYIEFISETEKRLILYDPSMYSVDLPEENYDIMDAERRFVNQLLSGDYDQAKSILYQILAYYRCKDGISLYIMRCRMFGLINMMINVLHELEPDITASFYKECQPIERLLSAKKMSELEAVLFDIVENLIGRQEHLPNEAQDKIPLIIGYIKGHYYDSNLSVQAIADEFGLSLPYLSRIFKETEKVGLLTFINQYRIDKAKELLDEDDTITLADLAQKVGYNCSQTLIRTFKRHEGITPGIYRMQKRSILDNNDNKSSGGKT